MNDSYKKRLYTQALSLSAAVLMAFLAQGKAAADQQNSTESQPAANQIEAVTPATEAAQAVPNQTGEKEQTPAPAADNPAVSAAAQTRAAASEEAKTQLADSTVYMSEPAELKETVQGQASQAGKLTWTLDNKPIADWKTWNMDSGTFTGQPFVTIEEKADGNDLHLNLQFQKLFGDDLSLRSPHNIRRTYRNFIGSHELVGTSQDLSLTIRKNIVLRPYEDFHSHEEMLAALKNGNLDYKLPVLINNTHADEQPGIDIITGLFKTFATKDQVSFKTSAADGSEKMVTLNIQDLLKKFIFLFDFTENPDGDVLNTRALANGLDPNRDTGYQANPETRTVAGLINKWNPIALYDIHGFVKEFLIEPATPPHDPNFEYDLLADLMLDNAHHMGRAGVANSGYDKYIIPKLDWGDGWDDSFSGYTAVYSMYHGILGHTIEIPEGNQESYKAGYYAVLGGLDYLAQNPDKLMEMRLNFYLRGINKVEDPKAENELVGPDGQVVGRIKKGQEKFFPDYYVIPMGVDKDNDTQEAFNMIDYFKRNGVLVKELKEDSGNYKKGDLVVDMAQAKRGYANHVLYKGSNESKWAAMYAELVVNFPDMKGFKAQPVFGDKLFEGKLGDVTALRAARTSQVDHKAPYYVIANTSESAVKAVNQALAEGKKVYLTDDGYIVDTPTFTSLLDRYAIYGDALYKIPQGPTLKPLKVYAPPHQFSWAGVDAPAHTALALKNMGFEIVNSPEEADVIVLESNNYDKSLVGLKPTIVVGGSAMQRLEKLGILDGFDAERFKNGSDYEGLMKAIIQDQDPLTSGYKKDGLFYSNSGNWIAKIPANFRTLASIAGSDFYIAGWWPGNEQLANKVVAIAGTYKEQPLFVYAGNPTNRLHPVHFYRWISNAIFGSQLAELTDLPSPATPDPTYQAPSQTVLDWKPATVNPPAQTVVLTYKSQTLPQTGSQEKTASFTLAGILIAGAAGLLLLKKKED